MSSLGTDTSYRLSGRDQRWPCWSLSRAHSQNQGTQITAHRAQGGPERSQRMLSATNMIFFRWRVYWGSEQFRPTPTTCRSFPNLP